MTCIMFGVCFVLSDQADGSRATAEEGSRISSCDLVYCKADVITGFANFIPYS